MQNRTFSDERVRFFIIEQLVVSLTHIKTLLSNIAIFLCAGIVSGGNVILDEIIGRNGHPPSFGAFVHVD